MTFEESGDMEIEPFSMLFGTKTLIPSRVGSKIYIQNIDIDDGPYNNSIFTFDVTAKTW